MLEEEFSKLLEKEWEEDEKELVKRIMEGLLYYKRFIPKNFKEDILSTIQLCNKLKNDLENKKEEQETIKKHEKDKNEELNNLYIQIENIRNDIEELKTIILIDKKSKTSIQYKFYKKIIKIIFKKLSKE